MTGRKETGIVLPLLLDANGYLLVDAALSLQPAPASPGSTTLLVVTDVTPVAVVAVTACSVITVREDASVANSPTVNFSIRRPLNSSTMNQYFAGQSYSFTAPFGTQWQPGQTVGYIQLPATGSTTFSKDEQ